jgi:adenylyl- and sulfurtransferase ThiI
MATTDTDVALHDALEAFEASLATPVVSGELAVWSDLVRAAWNSLLPLVFKQATELNPKLYDEITNQDPELFAQIDKLKAEDAALTECCLGLNQTVERVAKLAPLIEPDERKFSEQITKLQKEGAEFVIRVRKQQVAVQTWYQEAFNRDRGVAD